MEALIKQDTVDRIILLQRIVDKKVTQIEATEEIGLSARQIRRLMKLYRTNGVAGFVAKPRSSSNNCVSLELKERVLSIVRAKYIDFGPTLVSEKLEELDGIKVSRETLRKWLIAADLWNRPLSKPSHAGNFVVISSAREFMYHLYTSLPAHFAS